MGPVGPGFKLRVGLGGNEPGMVWELYHFHNPPVGGQAGEHHAAFYKRGAVVVVDLVAVPVALINGGFAVQAISFGGLVQDAWVGTQP